MWNERYKITAVELKIGILVCKLNLVFQKLIPHSTVHHSFISNSLSLVHISEIKGTLKQN